MHGCEDRTRSQMKDISWDSIYAVSVNIIHLWSCPTPAFMQVYTFIFSAIKSKMTWKCENRNVYIMGWIQNHSNPYTQSTTIWFSTIHIHPIRCIVLLLKSTIMLSHTYNMYIATMTMNIRHQKRIGPTKRAREHVTECWNPNMTGNFKNRRCRTRIICDIYRCDKSRSMRCRSPGQRLLLLLR